MSSPTKRGPLSGLRVVEFGGLAPSSIACLMLSEMGADVIRIDRRGHQSDVETNALRRSRRSIILDLKNPVGVALAQRLVESADVVVDPYRPGVLERLGLGPTEMLTANPRLIFARLTGWGQDGPMSQGAGHDITYLALTGALHPIGPADQPPTPPLNYVADIAGGTLPMVIGVLAALQDRHATGKGQVVDAAMTDAVPMVAATLYRLLDFAGDTPRGSIVLDGSAPYYRCYTCADGGFIAVGAIEPQFYTEFVLGLGLVEAELLDRADQANWPRLSEQFAAIVATRTRDEWAAQFDGTDACVAPVLQPLEAPHHPHMKHRGSFISLNGNPHPAPVPRLSRSGSAEVTAPPAPGAHTRAVLAELGLSQAELDAALESGAINEEVFA